MKKKVLFNMYDLEIGGAEKSLLGILNLIDYSKYDVDLFLYSKSGDLLKYVPREVNILPEIKVYKSLCKSTKENFKEGYYKLGVIKALSKYKAILREIPLAYDQYMNQLANNILPELDGDYDVAISNIWPHDLVVNKVKAKKKIGWIHTDYSRMKIDYKMDKNLLKKLDCIVSVSEHCKNNFEDIQGDLKNKSIYLENIISKSLIDKLSKEVIEEKSIFAEENINILTIARFHKEKGVDRILEVCEKLRRRNVKFTWYLIGFGGEESFLREGAKRLNLKNYFVILGKKINPYPYLKAADIYVQPSRYEGKSLCITEAKILSKPIISTDYDSVRDQLINRKTGIIVENSTDGIYKGILEIINDDKLRNSIIEELKSNNYSNENDIEKIYELMS